MTADFTAGCSSEDDAAHLLPQRRQDDQECYEGEGGEERGGGRRRTFGRFGGGDGWWVGILVAADAGHGLVSLVRLGAAEVAVAHVLTAFVAPAGERLELVEVFIRTAPLAVTAGSGRTIILTI